VVSNSHQQEKTNTLKH